MHRKGIYELFVPRTYFSLLHSGYLLCSFMVLGECLCRKRENSLVVIWISHSVFVFCMCVFFFFNTRNKHRSRWALKQSPWRRRFFKCAFTCPLCGRHMRVRGLCAMLHKSWPDVYCRGVSLCTCLHLASSTERVGLRPTGVVWWTRNTGEEEQQGRCYSDHRTRIEIGSEGRIAFYE